MPTMQTVIRAAATPRRRTNGSICNFANDLALLALFRGLVFIEEKLIFFVTSQLSFIGEQCQKTSRYNCPDNEHCRYGAHRRFPPPIIDRADKIGWLVVPVGSGVGSIDSGPSDGNHTPVRER